MTEKESGRKIREMKEYSNMLDAVVEATKNMKHFSRKQKQNKSFGNRKGK